MRDETTAWNSKDRAERNKRIWLQQPGAVCGRCSVSMLCGNASHYDFEVWLSKKRLMHVHCPACDRHGVFSVRTGKEVFPAPKDCPVVLMEKARVKICVPCYRGQQIQHGGVIEPEF
jgi:hypothetical protein